MLVGGRGGGRWLGPGRVEAFVFSHVEEASFFLSLPTQGVGADLEACKK